MKPIADQEDFVTQEEIEDAIDEAEYKYGDDFIKGDLIERG